MSFPWKHSEQLLLKSFPFASFRLKKHGAPEIDWNPLFNMPRLAFIKSGEFKSGVKCIIFIQNQPDMEKVWSRNACCLIQCSFVHEKIMFNLTLGELLKTFRNLTNLHHNERTICFIFLKHRSKHGGNMPSNPNGPQKKNFFLKLTMDQEIDVKSRPNFNRNQNDNNMKHMVYIIMICVFVI